MRDPSVRGLVWVAVVLLVGAFAGCGDDDVVPGIDGGGGSDAAMRDSGALDAGAVHDAGVGVDAGSSVDAGVGTDAGAATDAGGEVDAGTSLDAGAPTDAGPPRDAATSVVVTVTDFFAWSNCMPIVAPDPVRASWTVHVTGATGATATVTDAKLTIDAGVTPFMQSLTLASTAIALTGGAGSAMQSKMSGTPAPTGACSTLCSATASHLELTVEVDGVPYTVTADDGYSCPV